MGFLNFSRNVLNNVDELSIPLNSRELEVDSINYMDYFLKERNEFEHELLSPITNHLESLSHTDLVNLGMNIISITLGFMRKSAESITLTTTSSNNEEFYIAVICHLSDAVHNILSHLDESSHEYLISYITEFFVFIECFERFKDRPNSFMKSEYTLFLFRLDIRETIKKIRTHKGDLK